MTQEMEALAFEGSQGVELTDEEAEESARAYDEAQVVLKTEHDRICGKPHDQMLVLVLAGGEGSGRGRGEGGRRGRAQGRRG